MKGIKVVNKRSGFYVTEFGIIIAGPFDREDDAYQAKANHIKRERKAWKQLTEESKALRGS